MAQAVATQNNSDITRTAEQVHTKKTITGIYLITGTGLEILMGRDADEIRQKIEQDTDHSPLDYRFFDDDKRAWAYCAVKDGGGTIKPLTFPNLDQYSLTSPQLYTKAVTHPHILAHAVGLLNDKPLTMWDKMLKPTTIILAILGIVLIMAIFMVAAQG